MGQPITSTVLNVTINELHTYKAVRDVEETVKVLEFSYVTTLYMLIVIKSENYSEFYQFPRLVCPNLRHLSIKSNVHLVLDYILPDDIQELEALNITSTAAEDRTSELLRDDTHHTGVEVLIDFPHLWALKSVKTMAIKNIEWYDHRFISFNRNSTNTSLRVHGPENLERLVEHRDRPITFRQGWNIYEPSIVALSLEYICLVSTQPPRKDTKLCIHSSGSESPENQFKEYQDLKELVAFGHYNSAHFDQLPKLREMRFPDYEPSSVAIVDCPNLRTITYQIMMSNRFIYMVTWPNIQLYTVIRSLMRYSFYFWKRFTIPIYKFKCITAEDNESSFQHVGNHQPDTPEWLFLESSSVDGSFGLNKKRALFFLAIDVFFIQVLIVFIKYS